jgi:hypothetical protein
LVTPPENIGSDSSTTPNTFADSPLGSSEFTYTTTLPKRGITFPSAKDPFLFPNSSPSFPQTLTSHSSYLRMCPRRKFVPASYGGTKTNPHPPKSPRALDSLPHHGRGHRFSRG